MAAGKSTLNQLTDRTSPRMSLHGDSNEAASLFCLENTSRLTDTLSLCMVSHPILGKLGLCELFGMSTSQLTR